MIFEEKNSLKETLNELLTNGAPDNELNLILDSIRVFSSKF